MDDDDDDGSACAGVFSEPNAVACSAPSVERCGWLWRLGYLSAASCLFVSVCVSATDRRWQRLPRWGAMCGFVFACTRVCAYTSATVSGGGVQRPHRRGVLCAQRREVRMAKMMMMVVHVLIASQGYLVHNKYPLPQGPRHSPTVGS